MDKGTSRFEDRAGCDTAGNIANARYRVQSFAPGLDVAHAMNAVGDVAGDSTRSASRRAVLVREGVMRELGTLGGGFSTARGINSAGHIVGASLTAGDEAHHGFLYVDGEMFDLNDLAEPGWEIVHAFSINDAGDILAIANRGDGDHPVLLTRRS